MQCENLQANVVYT